MGHLRLGARGVFTEPLTWQRSYHEHEGGNLISANILGGGSLSCGALPAFGCGMPSPTSGHLSAASLAPRFSVVPAEPTLQRGNHGAAESTSPSRLRGSSSTPASRTSPTPPTYTPARAASSSRGVGRAPPPVRRGRGVAAPRRSLSHRLTGRAR